jgi:hypothetical protein
VAAAGGDIHAALGRQRRDFARAGAGIAVTDPKLAVEVVAPCPDAVASAYDERVLGAHRHAYHGLAELSDGADGEEVGDVAIDGLKI